MKRILKIFISLLLLSAVLVSALSCKEKSNERSELGLHFTLLADMEKREVSYADICYTNIDVELFVNVFTREELDDPQYLDLNEDITVEDFANTFIINNEYDAEYQYDPERGASFFDTVVSDEYNESYYYFTFMRNYDFFYVIGMECDLDKREMYSETFKTWSASMYIDESITK